MGDQERLLDIHIKVAELHSVVCGRGGTLDRLEEAESAIRKLEGFQIRALTWAGVGACLGTVIMRYIEPHIRSAL